MSIEKGSMKRSIVERTSSKVLVLDEKSAWDGTYGAWKKEKLPCGKSKMIGSH